MEQKTKSTNQKEPTKSDQSETWFDQQAKKLRQMRANIADQLGQLLAGSNRNVRKPGQIKKEIARQLTKINQEKGPAAVKKVKAQAGRIKKLASQSAKPDKVKAKIRAKTKPETKKSSKKSK